MTNREIDREMAEEVMGWKKLSFSESWISGASTREWAIEGYDCWKPTERIDNAWLVVEKMSSNREFIRLLMASYHSRGSLFDSIVSFFKDKEAPWQSV